MKMYSPNGSKSPKHLAVAPLAWVPWVPRNP